MEEPGSLRCWREKEIQEMEKSELIRSRPRARAPAIDVLRKALEKGDTKVDLEIAKLSGAFNTVKRDLERKGTPDLWELLQAFEEEKTEAEDPKEKPLKRPARTPHEETPFLPAGTALKGL